MRPVNLIPPEQRRGDRAPLRTGPVSYAVVGALAAALVGVLLVVSTSNTISDRASQVAELTAQRDQAQATGQALRPYADFAALRAAREATIRSLATSRFDWERVMRELALVIPKDVWLTGLQASAGSGSADAGSGEGELAGAVSGPSLSITGCGVSHDAVARFVAALEDIDGVTRVGLSRSEKPDAAASGGGGSDCRTRKFIAGFEVVAAFDAVPTPAAASATPSTPGTPVSGAATAATAVENPEQQANDATTKQTDKARKATNLVPGVVK